MFSKGRAGKSSMTDYETIKKRCAEDPEYREKYLAMRARNNQKARDRKKAAKAARSPEEIQADEERRAEKEKQRIEKIVAANKSRAKPGSIPRPKPERRSDLPDWKKDKPGRLLALCGWNRWS